MKVIIEDLAKECITDMFYYNYQFSPKNAIETDKNINLYLYKIEENPYIGRYIPKVPDKKFRELIYRKNRTTGYRIVYYISEITDTIHILYVANCKQDFNRALKLHNYFNNFFRF